MTAPLTQAVQTLLDTEHSRFLLSEGAVGARLSDETDKDAVRALWVCLKGISNAHAGKGRLRRF